MGFENLELQLSYRSDKDNVYKDFFEKCIKESISYDRAVGYFTSGSLKLMSKGLEEFLFNSGTIRIITSPNFSSEDLEAIMAGEDLKKIIDEKILKEMENKELIIIDRAAGLNNINFTSKLSTKEVIKKIYEF